jgi:hypothetical protein
VGDQATAFELVTFASVAAGTPAYTIVVFQSNESFRYFEPVYPANQLLTVEATMISHRNRRNPSR